MDPMRLAAQIVSGVGFIGAGVILKRGNDAISGLTTAAMVWSASGLGIAAGAGFYIEAFFAVLLIIVAINLLPFSLKLWGPRQFSEREFTVKIILNKNKEMTTILDEITQGEIRIKNVKIRDLNDESQQIQFTATAPGKKRTTEVYYAISQIKHVVAVEVENI